MLLASCTFDASGTGPSAAKDGAPPPAEADAAEPPVEADAAEPVPDAAPPADAFGCPEGYERAGVRGTGYRFVGKKVEWLEAEQACEADGAGTHLVIVDDLEELGHVTALAGPGGGFKKLWIGMTDVEDEDDWRYVTGDPVPLELQFWSPGEPNDSGDCGAVYLAHPSTPDMNGRFDDYDCDDDARIVGFVCECDGLVPAPPPF